MGKKKLKTRDPDRKDRNKYKDSVIGRFLRWIRDLKKKEDKYF